MKYLDAPVAYLQDHDFDAQGNLIADIPRDIPTVVMLQAEFCGYCTQAKPAFQEFCNTHNGEVFCATVQSDGSEPGEKELGKRLSKIIPGFRGFPEYVLYKNGKRVDKKISGRSVADLKAFAGV